MPIKLAATIHKAHRELRRVVLHLRGPILHVQGCLAGGTDLLVELSLPKRRPAFQMDSTPSIPFPGLAEVGRQVNLRVLVLLEQVERRVLGLDGLVVLRLARLGLLDLVRVEDGLSELGALAEGVHLKSVPIWRNMGIQSCWPTLS